MYAIGDPVFPVVFSGLGSGSLVIYFGARIVPVFLCVPLTQPHPSECLLPFWHGKMFQIPLFLPAPPGTRSVFREPGVS